MQIKCSHVRTLYNKPDVDFRIAVYRPFPFQEVEEEFVAKGNGIPLDSCLDITFDGSYQDEDEPGRKGTLVVKSFTSKVKRTRGSVLGYLSSGAIKGVGYGLAKSIVDTFGLDAVDILEQEPERLREVKGIGEYNLQMIIESFAENREIQGLMEYLGQFDISVNKARRIAAHYGARALEVVQSDIYHLCDVVGFGFVTVDEMARKLGHPMNTLPRVKAAAVYTLQENRSQGHLYMEPDQFLEALKTLLNRECAAYQFADADLRPLANEALQSDKLAFRNKSVYLEQDYRNEKDFAALMARRLAREQNQTEAIPPLPDTGISLSEEQEHAVLTALQNNTCIITGRPGTGKTTTLKTFLMAYARQTAGRERILLCAPTGRAARRMAEATGCSAYTVHKAFGLMSEDEEQRGDENRTQGGVVVIDEVSMMDMWLAAQVIARIDPSTKLILVGDPDQLPSVGPGNVLQELIRFGGIPTVHLRQIFRQAEGSAIAENAKRIAERDTGLVFDKDSFIYLPAVDQKKAKELICTLYMRASSKVGAESVQILTPMRKRGECSANTLNTAIQQMARKNPEQGVKHFDRFFCVGDPVMQTKNLDGINNGDVGVVIEADPPKVKVSFPMLDMEKEYDGESLGILDLAYASTVHKSQGGEYPVVLMPVLREHAFMLTRNLLYTAITRGKKRVVLVGDERAVRRAVLTEDTTKRRTHLANRLRTEIRARLTAAAREKGEMECEDLQSA